MPNGTESAPAPEAEAEQPALLGVVKGLRDQPPLLFGIGAGLVLIAVLAATTSIVLVLIVSGVLVAALVAWLVYEARTGSGGGGRARARADARRARIRGEAEVAVIEDEGTPGTREVDVDARGAEIGGRASVGRISSGRTRSRRRKRG